MGLKRKYVEIAVERKEKGSGGVQKRTVRQISKDVKDFVERRRQRIKERRSIRTDAERHSVNAGQGD